MHKALEEERLQKARSVFTSFIVRNLKTKSTTATDMRLRQHVLQKHRSSFGSIVATGQARRIHRNPPAQPVRLPVPPRAPPPEHLLPRTPGPVKHLTWQQAVRGSDSSQTQTHTHTHKPRLARPTTTARTKAGRETTGAGAGKTQRRAH